MQRKVTRQSSCGLLGLPSDLACYHCAPSIYKATLKGVQPKRIKKYSQPWHFKWAKHRVLEKVKVHHNVLQFLGDKVVEDGDESIAPHTANLPRVRVIQNPVHRSSRHVTPTPTASDGTAYEPAAPPPRRARQGAPQPLRSPALPHAVLPEEGVPAQDGGMGRVQRDCGEIQSHRNGGVWARARGAEREEVHHQQTGVDPDGTAYEPAAPPPKRTRQGAPPPLRRHALPHAVLPEEGVPAQDGGMGRVQHNGGEIQPHRNGGVWGRARGVEWEEVHHQQTGVDRVLHKQKIPHAPLHNNTISNNKEDLRDKDIIIDVDTNNKVDEVDKLRGKILNEDTNYY